MVACTPGVEAREAVEADFQIDFANAVLFCPKYLS